MGVTEGPNLTPPSSNFRGSNFENDTCGKQLA
jgi:hypothetical protein